MKRAIVFAGGGSKGAYEFGAWKALRELGEEFDLAVGTSIGSINAGFYVQNDFDAAGELWSEMNLDTVMHHGINLEKSFDSILEQRESIAPFLKTYFKDGAGADITPFIECIHKYADEKKFFASPIDYALMTVRHPDMQPMEIYKKDIAPGYYVRWINASCACFPAFPKCEIDGQFYIDGGYYDNLPIATAIKMGSDEIIAVDLRPDGTHAGYDKHPFVKCLKPSRDLGSFLCFKREILDNLITLGYHDTLRAYGKLGGKDFFLADSPASQRERHNIAHRFLKKMTVAEVNYESSRQSIMTRHMRGSPFAELLAKELTPPYTADAFFLRAMELALKKAGADPDCVYTAEEMIDRVKEAYAEIRDISQFDLTAAAVAVSKMGEENKKGFLSELKRGEPEAEDHIIALLAGILYDSKGNTAQF